MRIAILTRRFDSAGGGTERDLIVTAQGLRAAGHQVTIFAEEIRGATGDWDVRRVGVGPRLGRALSLIRFAWTAAPAARRAGTDLVLSFARCVGADVMRSGGGAHASYLRAARKWRGALSATAMRLSPYHQVQMLVERQAFRSPSLKRAIAVSNFVRDDLIREFGLAPEKALTIYNGVDLDRFRPAADPSERAAIRQKFVVPASARVVAFVGNGFARKGLGFLIEAWPLVAGGAFLLVVGADRQTDKFARRASALNVGARVVFTGPQPNVEEIFHAADAFAMPSLFEPFGNVVMEAMASGLPAMTSAFSGVAELIPPSMRGFRVENPDDVGEVALRLGALFDAPASLAAEARATAEKFTWSRYASELNALLESIG
ncbi:MAG TPA: glycosyltransferase family 4 protein [Candidatus Binatus sp.]|uniref:glycosyltransferase family 4 protein n=1 Tax=Candidatus Binatus sp. TaxID=2811406 RepID=UPI002B45E0F8|nr:glycosyltransferase family 4 protein [Candidatus Binatus sp.]HKN12874.1 glycosyltransferase family 4 protein [Candidatus Binatus sp.]